MNETRTTKPYVVSTGIGEGDTGHALSFALDIYVDGVPAHAQEMVELVTQRLHGMASELFAQGWVIKGADGRMLPVRAVCAEGLLAELDGDAGGQDHTGCNPTDSAAKLMN